MKINYPNWEKQPWTFRLLRKMSIPLTWIILKTPLRPNDITFIAIIFGIISAVCFALNFWNVGVILMLITMLLDFTDGEVSRFKGLNSKEGSYLDKIYIFSVHPVLMAGFTLGIFSLENNKWILIAGFINTISVVLFAMTISYAKEIIIWRHIKKLLYKISLNPEAVINNTSQNLKKIDNQDGEIREIKINKTYKINQSQLLRFLKLIISAWDFPILFLIMALTIIYYGMASVVSFSLQFSPMIIYIYFYAITYPFIICIFLIKNVYMKRIDIEYFHTEQYLLQVINKCK